MKRWQNKVAESRSTLPVVTMYGAGVWLLAGLVTQHWWIQFACFVLSTFIMVELNNSNALIRIYSRTVSSAFILLSCAACFLFASLPGAIFQLCIISSLYTLFRCYQDKTATGWTFYTFLLLGLASLAQAEALWLIPAYWLLMATTIYCFKGRTFTASLLGLLLPYVAFATGILCLNEGDFTPLGEPLGLTEGGLTLRLLTEGDPRLLLPDYASVSVPLILTSVLVAVLSLTGTIHYIRTSSRDNIRIRQLFYSLILLDGLATVLLILAPRHYDAMLRLMIITCSPLIGHFLALTSTRITNAAFYVITVTTLALTALNLWML